MPIAGISGEIGLRHDSVIDRNRQESALEKRDHVCFPTHRVNPSSSPRTAYTLSGMPNEMLSGSLPFKGGYEQSVIHATMSHDPESLTGVRKDIPRELVVDRFGEIIASSEWRLETPGQFVSPNQPLLLRYPR